MDARCAAGVKPFPPEWFAALRALLGLYLFARFAALLPYGAELFSREGVLPDPAANFTFGILPNPLARWDSPAAVEAFLAALIGLSLLLALGWRRRVVALLLAYGSACLFNRNNLIANPSLPCVGVLLLLMAVIPAGEPWSLERRDRRWVMPVWAFRTAWILMAVGYTYSGLDKLLCAPSWRDGSALGHVLQHPLARPGLARDLLLAAPPLLLSALTWLAVALEAAFLPLSLHPLGRRVAWAALAGMHLGVMLLISFTELSLGMLLLHLFTFDPEWLPRGSRAQAASTTPNRSRTQLVSASVSAANEGATNTRGW